MTRFWRGNPGAVGSAGELVKGRVCVDRTSGESSADHFVDLEEDGGRDGQAQGLSGFVALEVNSARVSNWHDSDTDANHRKDDHQNRMVLIESMMHSSDHASSSRMHRRLYPREFGFIEQTKHLYLAVPVYASALELISRLRLAHAPMRP